MTQSVAHFNLRPFHGSAYDLWYPSERGVRKGANKVRPRQSDTERSWPGHAFDRSKVDELTNDLATKHNLVVEPGGFLTVDMDSPMFPELVSKLAQLHGDREVFPANGFIRIKLVNSAVERSAWFEYEPKWDLPHISEPTGNKLDLLSCNADAAQPGIGLGSLSWGSTGTKNLRRWLNSMALLDWNLFGRKTKGFATHHNGTG